MRTNGALWFRLYLGVGLGLSLLACEERVELNVGTVKSRLVVNSRFEAHRPVELLLSATQPIGRYQSVINDARVLIFEGQDLAEELTYQIDDGIGVYRSVDFTPKVGHHYTLHVTAPGFDPVSAVSFIPEPVAITSLSVDRLIRTPDGSGDMMYDYLVLIDYADPDGTNYYELRLRQQVVPFEVGERGDTIVGQPFYKSIRAADAPQEETGGVRILMEDKPEDGPLSLRLESRVDYSSEFPGTLTAELRTVSPEYYFFQLGEVAARDLTTVGNLLTQPVVTFHNVDSGLGIFAGYNTDIRKLTLSY